ncbi:MAG: type II secretion system F family protein [Patescibacteria group bacterium]
MTNKTNVVNPKSVSLSGDDKLMLVGNLGTMLAAGISIIEAVDSLHDDAKGSLRIILSKLKADIEQGLQVYESLGQFTQVFDGVTINIIRAAEQSGNLDKVLKDVRETMMKDMEFKDKVKGAMTYPVFILIIFVAVLLGMLYGIVPKIGGVFKSLRMPLPLPTQILIAMSDFLIKHTVATFVGLVVLVAGFMIFYKKNRDTVLRVFLGMPLIKPLSRDIDLTRFTRSMSLLLSSGIPITNALELTKDVVAQPQVRDAIQDGYNAILQGERLSTGIEKRGKIFPSILKKMIEVGEKSGSLDKSLQEASDFLDYQTSKKIKTFTTLLEPLMLVLVAGLVGGMMMAIVAPIYGLISSINTKR